MPCFMAEQVHTQQAADAAAQDSREKQSSLGDPAAVSACPAFV